MFLVCSVSRLLSSVSGLSGMGGEDKVFKFLTRDFLLLVSCPPRSLGFATHAVNIFLRKRSFVSISYYFSNEGELPDCYHSFHCGYVVESLSYLFIFYFFILNLLDGDA